MSPMGGGATDAGVGIGMGGDRGMVGWLACEISLRVLTSFEFCFVF